jgi:hypothetical protein
MAKPLPIKAEAARMVTGGFLFLKPNQFYVFYKENFLHVSLVGINHHSQIPCNDIRKSGIRHIHRRQDKGHH